MQQMVVYGGERMLLASAAPQGFRITRMSVRSDLCSNR